MNDFGKSFVHKLIYSFGANVVSMLVAVLTIIILPKYMTVDDYGIYQLFLFYFGYVGFLHFGVLGGAIVKYSGKKYFDLDFSVLKTQCIFLFCILIIITSLMLLTNMFFKIVTDYYIIIIFIISMLAQHIIWYVIAILQMSNRIEDASKLTLWERFSWGSLSVIAMTTGFRSIYYVLMVYGITRIIIMFYGLWLIPEVIFSKVNINIENINEFKSNFLLGFPVTLSDICSILVLGIIRFAISTVWDITIFAKTSLILSATLFFLTFINSVSVMLLPALKQLNNSLSNSIYPYIFNITSILSLSVLVAYYPIKIFIVTWIPKYADSTIYMGILFPIVYFETIFNLIIVTYLKKLLHTDIILGVNLISMIISILGAIVFCYYFKNIELTILLIPLVIGIRCNLGYYIVNRLLKIKEESFKIWSLSMVMLIIFELCTNVMSFWMGAFVYALLLIIFVGLNLSILKTSWRGIKMIIY